MARVDQFRFACHFGPLEDMDPDDYDFIVPFTLHHQNLLRNRFPALEGKRFWVPPSEVESLCDDKLSLNRHLSQSQFAAHVPHFGQGLGSRFPYIIKPRHGEFGQNASLIKERQQERRYADLLNSDAYFWQVFLPDHHEFSLHLLIVGGTILFASTVLHSLPGPFHIKGVARQSDKLRLLPKQPSPPNARPS